ncbi:transcriptional regulator [Paenibacillus cremeus]|uniref:Transcriptional regulator n=1 Tax=Paenibacillus cremeus TaxID=2163881 RepID=A0A559KCT3_9BACL|nr:transcriptional regulator [Paenibacillus cremeus]TVY09942.1 transcriptional regulator [Paenibacillus cremeus]
MSLTPFGKWFYDEQDAYNQVEFAEEIGITTDTLRTALTRNGWIPSQNVMKKIMDGVKQIDPSKRASHFWDY